MAAVSAMASRISLQTRSQRQMAKIHDLVTKHLQDETLAEFLRCADFRLTSTERNFQHVEHTHLATALDILNSYQRDRQARYAGMRLPDVATQFTSDPRTRLVELLKRWLREHLLAEVVSEDDVRRFTGLCRDLLNHPDLFRARNKRSFMRALAEVYDHLRWQLREVLERDHSCAELMQKAVTYSKNLLSDSVGYLLLAATDLSATDALPSIEAVALYQSLPFEAHPLPTRQDKALQKTMRDAWRTQCGSLVAALMSAPWCVRLFAGRSANGEMSLGDVQAAQALPEMIERAKSEFERGNFKGSALCGPFRQVEQRAGRQKYLDSVGLVFDLAYIVGEGLFHFQRISESLGDYGMIRVQRWLHPFLKVFSTKTLELKAAMESLSEAVEECLVLARSKGHKVAKPVPSIRMSQRASECIQRAVSGAYGRKSNAESLLETIEKLRQKSAPERLPHLIGELGDTFRDLQSALSSQDFRARAGSQALLELPALETGELPAELALRSALMDGESDISGSSGTASVSGRGTPRSSPTPPREHSPRQTQTGSRVRLISPRIGSQARSISPRMLRAAFRLPGRSPGRSPGHSPVRLPFFNRDRGSSDGLLEPRETAAFGGDRAPRQTAAFGRRDASPRSQTPPRAGERRGLEGDPSPRSQPPPEFGARRGSDRGASPRHAAPRGGSAEEMQVAPSDPIAAAAAVAAMRPSLEAKPASNACIQATVWKLEAKTSGWQRRDQRSLQLLGSCLQIFEPGSSSKIKMQVDLSKDVESCVVQGDGVMSLVVRRLPEATSMFSPRMVSPRLMQRSMGSPDMKPYFFEFPTAALAQAFHGQISEHRSPSGRGSVGRC